MTSRIPAAALAALTAAAVSACGSSASGSPAKHAGTAGPASSSGGYGSGGYGSGGYGSASSATTSATGTSAGASTVRITHTSRGSLLVNNRGYTLYLFTADRRGSDRCLRVKGCAAAWPPYTVSGRESAGPGARQSLLGTINIGHGRRQVTYDGHPLYGYAGAGAPASTGYIGISSFGGTWYGVSASGGAVR